MGVEILSVRAAALIKDLKFWTPRLSGCGAYSIILLKMAAFIRLQCLIDQ